MHSVLKNGSPPYAGRDTIPSVDGLAKQRLDELKAFHIALESPVLQMEAEDDEVFATVIQLAIDDYGLGQKELADILQTQTSTVGRWKVGRNVPSVYSRPGILSAVASCISQHIAERE